jgi:NitT/TauT family transport system substrate-binding protein
MIFLNMTFLNRRSALAVAAIACIASVAHAQSDKPLEKVSMRFGYVATGNDLMWAYGREKGFFRAQGIDLDLREGKGSAVTAQTVASGADDFGVDIDGGAFLTLAGKGLKATAVMAPVPKSPIVLLSPLDKALKTPADLVGKKVAIAGGSGAATLLPVFFKKNKIAADQVTVINMQSSPLLTTLLTGRVDAVATNVVVQATLAAKGLKTYAMRYADFGLVMPGQYLITSNAYLAAHPDTVARMVKAMQQSMQATMDNPEAAADAFHRAYPSYDKATALAEAKIIMDLFRTPSTQGKPLGTVVVDDAKAGAASLQEAGQMPASIDVSTFVTNRFVK